MKINGLPWAGFGRYEWQIEAKSADGSWQRVAFVPIDIQLGEEAAKADIEPK